MNEKELWTEADFEEMGWHDSQIYSIHPPGSDLVLKLDIDYIFRWELNQETNRFAFWVSPCSLCFENVVVLKVDLLFDKVVGIYIDEIVRSNPELSASGELTFWQYIIRTDRGDITFESSGYRQIVHQQPVFSESQSLELPNRSWPTL